MIGKSKKRVQRIEALRVNFPADVGSHAKLPARISRRSCSMFAAAEHFLSFLEHPCGAAQ